MSRRLGLYGEDGLDDAAFRKALEEPIPAPKPKPQQPQPDNASRTFDQARCLDLVTYLQQQFRGLGLPELEAQAKALHASLWSAMKAEAEARHG